MTRIVAVGGDPGGAAALASVLVALQAGPNTSLRVLAYRQAVDVWARRGIRLERLPDAEHVNPAAWLLDQWPDLLLTSTSVNDVNHEAAFIRWTEREQIPSIAVLDFWLNYAERFTTFDRDAQVLPSAIAVMDERARREMVALGFPPERIVVTGQPALEPIPAFRAGWTEAQRDETRRTFAADATGKVVVFLSQPLSTEMAAMLDSHTQIDERAVLAAVALALDEIASLDDLDMTLVVRPHPRERLVLADLPRTRRVRMALSPNGDPWAAALAADLVIGMTTALLVEASLLGCVVLAVQPGEDTINPLPPALGGATTVNELGAVPEAVRKSLLDETYRARLRAASVEDVSAGATARVLALIQRTLKHRPLVSIRSVTGRP